MTERYRVRETDHDGRPVSGVGPDDAGPGDILTGPQPAWLVEQGYLERVEKPAPKGKG